jgi:hypothetical protein
MDFVWFSEQTAIISLNRFNKFIFAMERLVFSLKYGLDCYILFRRASALMVKKTDEKVLVTTWLGEDVKPSLV